MHALSCIKGNLPRLEALDIQIWFIARESSALDILDVVPRLKKLNFHASDWEDAILKFPVEQLFSLRWMVFFSRDVSLIFTPMSRLERGASFHLEWSLLDEPSEILGIHTTSKIAEYPFIPLPWPHAQFLSLSERSSFASHFQWLEILDVVITEMELLQRLSSLPSLEQLAISDHQHIQDEGIDQLLIADFLFSQLTRTPDDPYLVPCLHSFTCRSLLRFNDKTFLNCLCSRLYDDAPKTERFESWICSLPGIIASSTRRSYRSYKITRRRNTPF